MNLETVFAAAIAWGILTVIAVAVWTMTKEKELCQREHQQDRKKRTRRWLQGALTAAHDEMEREDRIQCVFLQSIRREQIEAWEQNHERAQAHHRTNILRCWCGDQPIEDDMLITERREARLLPRFFYIDIMALLERALRRLGIGGLE